MLNSVWKLASFRNWCLLSCGGRRQWRSSLLDHWDSFKTAVIWWFWRWTWANRRMIWLSKTLAKFLERTGFLIQQRLPNSTPFFASRPICPTPNNTTSTNDRWSDPLQNRTGLAVGFDWRRCGTWRSCYLAHRELKPMVNEQLRLYLTTGKFLLRVLRFFGIVGKPAGYEILADIIEQRIRRWLLCQDGSNLCTKAKDQASADAMLDV